MGRKECHGDWLRHFESELDGSPFRDGIGVQPLHGMRRPAHDLSTFDSKALERCLLIENVIQYALLAVHEVFTMSETPR